MNKFINSNNKFFYIVICLILTVTMLICFSFIVMLIQELYALRESLPLLQLQIKEANEHIELLKMALEKPSLVRNNTLIYTGIGGFTLGACIYYLAELFTG